MAKPKTKAELIEAATTNYENLLEMIANRTEEEKSREYDFSGDDRKKEAHWKRDRNLRDVLMHLYEWHQLLLNWLKNRDNEQKKAVFARRLQLANLRRNERGVLRTKPGCFRRRGIGKIQSITSTSDASS